MFYKQLKDWTLAGFYPYVPLHETSVETGNVIKTILNEMPAKVPGSIHADLLRNKMIKDPYKDMNSTECEWVSQRWWRYSTEFIAPVKIEGRLELVFEGIDYKAHIYFNGKKMGEHDNMFTPFVLDITDIYKPGETNKITVLLENAPDEMSQLGYTSKTFTQKARFTYKWDFGTRMVHLGLWLPVYVREYVNSKLDYFNFEVQGDARNGKAKLGLEISSITRSECLAKVELKYKGKAVYKASKNVKLVYGANFCNFNVTVDNPKLWWPLGHGEQNLYDLHVKLTENGKISHTVNARVGFKTVELTPNDNKPDKSLNYVFTVNGEKIYIKGANVTPLDMMYGTVDKRNYAKLVDIAKRMNVNMFRIWGGGLIEKEELYDLCDEAGIMLWQEFIQSSSGIENVPSVEPHFLELLAASAEHATKVKRNHASLAVWSGGNELRFWNEVPSTFEDPNIFMLKNIVDKNSPAISMLPTSASGLMEFTDPDRPNENFDIHGPWLYIGEKDHYTFYNKVDSLFHSEFGVEGMGNSENFPKFLSKKHLAVSNSYDNVVWRHHGEWWDGYYRDIRIFGSDFESLEEECLLSQFLQFDGMRYSLEANRRRQFRNSGSIIWQLNEPFPNVNCTSILDYYKNPKMCAYGVRAAYSPLNISVRYNALTYEVGEECDLKFYAVNDSSKEEFSYQIRVLIDGKEIKTFRGKANAQKCECIQIEELNFIVPDGKAIRIEITADGAEAFESKVLLLIKGKNGLCDRKTAADFAREVKQELKNL